MKIILRADVENLGRLGDVVTVKAGYGRNYLLPQGLAMLVTPGNLKAFELERKKLQARMDALRAAAEKSQELTPEALKAWVTAEVERNPLLKVIYYQSVDARTMQEVAAWDDSPRIQGCIAVQAGDIRLIDNIRIR